MGLPYESPSGAGGYDDDDYGMSGDERFSDDIATMGYDGYQHDTSGGYAADEDEYDDDDDFDMNDFNDDGPAGNPGRM
jgi:hypothetical protein